MMLSVQHYLHWELYLHLCALIQIGSSYAGTSWRFKAAAVHFVWLFGDGGKIQRLLSVHSQ